METHILNSELFSFLTGFPVSQTDLEFTDGVEDALELPILLSHHLSAGVASVHHHSWCWEQKPRLGSYSRQALYQLSYILRSSSLF